MAIIKAMTAENHHAHGMYVEWVMEAENNNKECNSHQQWS